VGETTALGGKSDPPSPYAFPSEKSFFKIEIDIIDPKNSFPDLEIQKVRHRGPPKRCQALQTGKMFQTDTVVFKSRGV